MITKVQNTKSVTIKIVLWQPEAKLDANIREI